MKKRLSVLVSGLAACMLLAGCGSITIPGGGGDEATVDLGAAKDGNVDISVKDGSGEGGDFNIDIGENGSTSTLKVGDDEYVTQTGENVEVPKEFPSDVPFPEGTKYTTVQNSTIDGKKLMAVGFEFTQDVESVIQMYKDYAKSKGYNISTEMSSTDYYTMTSGNKATQEQFGERFSVIIMVDADGNQTGRVSVSLAAK